DGTSIRRPIADGGQRFLGDRDGCTVSMGRQDLELHRQRRNRQAAAVWRPGRGVLQGGMKSHAGENSPLHIEEPQIGFARVRWVVAGNHNRATVGGQPSAGVVSGVSQSRELFAGAVQPNHAARTRKAVPVDEYTVLRDREVSQSLPLVVLHLGRYW